MQDVTRPGAADMMQLNILNQFNKSQSPSILSSTKSILYCPGFLDMMQHSEDAEAELLMEAELGERVILMAFRFFTPPLFLPAGSVQRGRMIAYIPAPKVVSQNIPAEQWIARGHARKKADESYCEYGSSKHCEIFRQ